MNFGTTVKKEVRNEVETSGKIWRYVAGEGEFEKSGQEPWAPKKGPKNFLKIFLKKKVGDVCENINVVSRCRRGDWYIRLRNVGKIEQHVVNTPPL